MSETTPAPEPQDPETEAIETDAEPEVEGHSAEAVLGLQKLADSQDTLGLVAQSCSSCVGGSC